MATAPKANKVKGLSLIELMIALTLSVLLTLGIIQLFESSRVTFNTNEALARVQENSRFAMEVLKREVRGGSTHGFCAGRLPITSHLRDAGTAINAIFDPNRTLSGWEYNGTGTGNDYTLGDGGGWSSSMPGGGALPGALAANVAPGSDVLLIKTLEPIVIPGPPPILVSGVDPSPTSSADDELQLNTNHNLRANSLVLMTDCSFSDLFHNMTGPTSDRFSKVGGVGVVPGNRNASATDWSVFHGNALQAFEVQMYAYYIGVNDDGDPGFYRRNLSQGINNAEAEELIRGAETFQVLYGFSAAAPAGNGEWVNAWLQADQIPAGGWNQVIALRIGLSVRSEGNADGDRSDVTFNNLAGPNIEIPGDGFLRQPVTTYIALRNQLLVTDL